VRDMANASLNFDKKLPPTYQSRERFISDPSKPLPEIMQKNDEINARKHEQHKAKYIFEEKCKIEDLSIQIIWISCFELIGIIASSNSYIIQYSS
jgi:hypothetical protein